VVADREVHGIDTPLSRVSRKVLLGKASGHRKLAVEPYMEMPQREFQRNRPEPSQAALFEMSTSYPSLKDSRLADSVNFKEIVPGRWAVPH
jgi:hypothetical protein